MSSKSARNRRLIAIYRNDNRALNRDKIADFVRFFRDFQRYIAMQCIERNASNVFFIGSLESSYFQFLKYNFI